MLTELFGSKTKVKTLVYIAAMGNGYASEISEAFKISNTQVVRTLDLLEQGEILVGHNSGRVRIYEFDKQWFLYKELKALLDKVISNMPLEDQEKYFMKRKRPRKKNKGL